jgi:hypothetical protein
VKLRYTRKGWYRFWGAMRTGSVDIRSGIVIPYMRDGVIWPDPMELWVGPFASATEAAATAPA